MSKIALIIVAHPDDEVLGCGGTVAKLVSMGWKIDVLFLADGETSRGSNISDNGYEIIRNRKEHALAACEILGLNAVYFEDFPDNRLDTVPLLDVVKKIEEKLNEIQPTVLFTHFENDLNIDHRIVNEAVQVACRPLPTNSVKRVYYFEVLSSTEWRVAPLQNQFSPNVFVDITETLKIKLQAMNAYYNELREFPHSRSTEAIKILAGYRGICSGTVAAEAFMLGRNIVELKDEL